MGEFVLCGECALCGKGLYIQACYLNKSDPALYIPGQIKGCENGVKGPYMAAHLAERAIFKEIANGGNENV